MGTHALTANHPAIGVDQKRHGTIGDPTFQDAETVGPRLIAGERRLLARDQHLGGGGLGVLRADLFQRERHREDLSPAVETGMEVVDHLAEGGQPVQARGDEGRGRAGALADLLEG